MMDATTDRRNRMVVFKTSAQIGKTSIQTFRIARTVDINPGPCMMVQPTLQMAAAWSTDRLTPMLRDTPKLRGKIRDRRSRTSDNTKLWKKFPGGHITITGANSPASLAGRPIRDLDLDEVERMKPTVEGDPVNLAIKRTTTFWDASITISSTPTTSDGKIELLWQKSDQCLFYVKFPCCGHEAPLVWEQVTFKRDPLGQIDPTGTYYQCEGCQDGQHDDVAINRMVREAERQGAGWRATAKFNGIKGFHVWQLYWPSVTMEKITWEWIDAQDNVEKLRTFFNTVLGRTFDIGTKKADPSDLMARAEAYGPEIPEGACLITVGADVQGDRIEAEVVAWGGNYEAWHMGKQVFLGSPAYQDDSDEMPEVWKHFKAWLLQPRRTANGHTMTLAAAVIDSGYHTSSVYKFVAPLQERRIYASKGASSVGAPVASLAKHPNRDGIRLVYVGTDTAKTLIYYWLTNVLEPGNEYQHYRKWDPVTGSGHDEAYFKQLTAERSTRTLKGGKYVDTWKCPDGVRNEALDISVYNLAALQTLEYTGGIDWRYLKEKYSRPVEDPTQDADTAPGSGDEPGADPSPTDEPAAPVPAAPATRFKRRRSSGYL